MLSAHVPFDPVTQPGNLHHRFGCIQDHLSTDTELAEKDQKQANKLTKQWQIHKTLQQLQARYDL